MVVLIIMQQHAHNTSIQKNQKYNCSIQKYFSRYKIETAKTFKTKAVQIVKVKAEQVHGIKGLAVNAV